jgi:hypothetical protein
MIAGETERSNSDEMTKPSIALAAPPPPRVVRRSFFLLLQFEPACTGCAV